jgi:DNA modification methylase
MNTEESKANRISRDNPHWSASYQDVCNMVDREIELREENARLREALAALSKRHDWTPGMGECICSEHMAAREILSRDEAKQGYVCLLEVVEPHLSSKKDRHLVHQIFSYPAKFQGYLPTALIEALTSTGDKVCDPYSGGGTTSAAAALLGRQCYGIDLNPIAVVVSRAKTTSISNATLTKSVALLRSLKPEKRKLLSETEWELMGTSLASFAEAVWSSLNRKRNDAATPLLATLLIKRIKLSCRRDKTHIRTAPFADHINYVVAELHDAFRGFQQAENFGEVVIDHGSNHEMDLKTASIDLIVTSPPYPGVDVEYNLIQLQRRDLGRCFRSDVGIRISESVLGRSAAISKKDLCDGGIAGSYWSNTELSLKEMNRVLKKDALSFLYVGFKTLIDRARFEKLADLAGFTIYRTFIVELGKERVASSRGLFHGRDTSMMETERLYVLRKK